MEDFAPLAAVTRDGLVESTHLGDLVVCDNTGKLLAAVGEPDRLAYFRSAAKPLQALTVVLSGAADKFALTDTELAACCASHSGSRVHVLTVQGILQKIGLDETALACGVHEPGDPEERRRLSREGVSPTPLHNNCSGKHAGMLASALALDAPVEDYLNRNHPVQRHIEATLSLATGVEAARFHYGADGCGAPTLAVPLRAMATSFARLANPGQMPDAFSAAARRIVGAMAMAPEMVSAPGAFNSELLLAGEGHLVAKGGAEGSFLAGIVDARGLGLAVKVADGSGRPLPPVVLHALGMLGGLPPAGKERMRQFVEPQIKNCHGVVVGTVAPIFNLQL